MWDVINFILILILLIIIIAVLLTVIYFYFSVRQYIDETLSHIGASIPIFNSYEYTSINYNQISLNDIDLLKENEYNEDIARLCCNINMSSYNIYANFDSRLNNGIKHIITINDNCFIYKIKKTNIKIISYRGTRSSDDIITDVDSAQCEMSGYDASITVHRGFYRLWSTQKDDIKRFVKSNFNKDTTLIVTGHSLGCASALFTSLLISKLNLISNNNIHLYMIAPPRVGNHHFIKILDSTIINNYSIINVSDIVPTLPFITFPMIGNTLLYENFTNRYLIDMQMGSVSLNHRLDTYMCALDNNCKDPIWKKNPILLKH